MSKIPAQYQIFCMVQGKALNFSSKLIMVEVQLGLERDKNHKLLQTIAELKPGQLQDKVHTSNSSCDIWSSFNVVSTRFGPILPYSWQIIFIITRNWSTATAPQLLIHLQQHRLQRNWWRSSKR